MHPAPLPEPTPRRRCSPRPARGPASLWRAAWLREAACAGADPDLFFP